MCASVSGEPLRTEPGASVIHLLAKAARERPDSPAVTANGRTVTYARYAGLVAGLARRLVALGASGERVALVMGNSLEMAVSILAGQAAGAQVVPLNPFYTERELAPILADAAPRFIIYDPVLASAVPALCRAIDTILLQADGLLDTSWVVLGPEALDRLLPQPGQLALVQYTGGTTGRSKGVELTHAQLAVNVEQREARLPTRCGEEHVLCVMPLFHVFALAMCLYLAIRAESRLVILPRYKPDAVIDALARERITILPAGPTIFTGLLQAPGFAELDFSALNACYSGSAPLPEEVLRRWRDVTASYIYEGFGQTEAGPVLTYAGPETARKVGSVGLPLPETTVEIVDLHRKRVVERGECGEIRARGPQVMSGYRNLPEETAAALQDGWLYTGDIGELDEDGYLFIRDRKKDMVIVGGYNVYPREVDEVLFQHPAVAEAAAFGIPDPFYGEIVAARAVLKHGASPSVDELLLHCRANLAPYKIPRRLEIVEALPKTAAGKIDKAALRLACS
jgi:long-chain acyl-CoA synthetase